MPHLLPFITFSDAEISQWLNVSKTISEDHSLHSHVLRSIEDYLKTKSYLVSNNISIADIALFVALRDNAANVDFSAYPNVTRWSTHVGRRINQSPFVQLQNSPTIFYKAQQAPPKPDTQNNATKAPKQEKMQPTKEKEKSTLDTSETKQAENTTTADDCDPSKLDFRIGVIRKCWDHPEADKLLCEEIDLGETAVRTIASGLRAFYKAEEMVGKKVVVLANLKDRTMVGFKSQVS
jgi:methionine--tRNA ligase beta chain